jgi:hypothetical protein
MLIIQCPHCQQAFEILEINCRIFRCGVYKKNYEQIPPHLPKQQCDELAKNEAIIGCGKPFELVPLCESSDKNENYSLDASYNVVKCDYI